MGSFSKLYTKSYNLTPTSQGMCFDLILNYITWKTNIVSHNEADCFGPDVVLNPFSPFTKSEAPTRFEPMTSARPVDALPTEL